MESYPLTSDKIEEDRILYDDMNQEEKRLYTQNKGWYLLLQGLSNLDIPQIRMGAITIHESVENSNHFS